MANHKSAIKRDRQSLVRRDRNRDTRLAVRTAIKKVRVSIEAGNKAEAKEGARLAEKAIATAARKGLYHRMNARRKISRLAKFVAAKLK